jgi:hypothetical protein
MYSLKLSHNHVLHVSQYAHMMPSQRRVSQVQALEINLANDNGIKLKDSYEFIVRQAGERDVRVDPSTGLPTHKLIQIIQFYTTFISQIDFQCLCL